jgi:DNA-binding CsgD family transcriptional regulator
LKKLGIGYFSYAEYHDRGNFFGLTNQGDFAEYYLKNHFERFDVLAINHSDQPYVFSGLYLWDTIASSKFHQFLSMANSFHLYHGCSIIRVDGDVKRSYNFATNRPDFFLINNLYTTKFHVLSAYIDYFLDCTEKIIQKSNWLKLTIPQNGASELSNNSPWLPNTEEQFLREINFEQRKYGAVSGTKKFSRREKQCLDLIVQGKCAKEIAKILNLSVRTIDFYISGLKKKANINKNSDLIIKILSSTEYKNHYLLNK